MSKQNEAPTKPPARTSPLSPPHKERESPTAVFDDARSPLSALQRVYHEPSTLTPADARTLQRTIGNQALGRLLVQRKMSVGPVDDQYEQEADAVARQVVGKLAGQPTTQRQEEEEEVQMSPLTAVQRQEEEDELQMSPLVPSISTLQRQDEDEDDVQMMPQTPVQRQEEEEEVQMSPLVPSISTLQRQDENEDDVQMMPQTPVQRQEEEEVQMTPATAVQRHPGHDEESVQMKTGVANLQRQGAIGAEGGELTADIEQSIDNARGAGQTLPGPVREPMEQAFGADFSSVRVHTHSQSDSLNRSLGARAFTTGQDIFFRSNEYNPGSSSGQELLAHELTHTVQQGAAPQKLPLQTRRTANKKGKDKVQPKKAAANVVQRRDQQSSLARIINAGINVSNQRGNLGQLGHSMDVWIEIDAGRHPETPANARPNTVYGLEFEYWEYVNVPQDNQGVTGEKPWNDIYGLKPDASTFDTVAPGCDLTWKAAVEQAAAGTLTGRKKIGFRDIPGLFEKVGRDVERTLKFRIVFNDGVQRQEMFATQLLRVNNGQLGYSAYVDSKGNSLEAHGFGGVGYAAGSLAETQSLAVEPGRLDATSLPSKAQILATIPQEAKIAVQTMVVEALNGSAPLFIDQEMAEFVSKVDAVRQEQGAGDWINTFSQAFMGDTPGGVAAGQYLIPNIAGTQRRQKALPSGGLLVALASGNNVLKMYYTDNTTKNVSMNFIPQLAAKNWTINVRSFSEIPTETVQNSLNIFRAMSNPTTLKQKPLNAGNTHLRKFSQQGGSYIVKVGEMVGSKIKRNNQVSVYDPEIRDVTGKWLKAQFGTKTGFIRAEKLAGLKSPDQWKQGQKKSLPALGGRQVMETYFEKVFRDQGNSHTVYSQLVASYPGMEGYVSQIYKKVFDENQFNKMQLDRETAVHGLELNYFQLSAMLNDGDHPAMITDVMNYLQLSPGQGDLYESIYNQHVPPLGHDVPATLGEIVHSHFTTYLRAHGSGYAIYNQLLADYPDFSYRLKPAYRQVFGEDQLQTMLQQRQVADFAVDVPDPDSIDNILEYFQFTTHAPFTLTDFVPTAGAAGAKFDTVYDPATGNLDMTLRVFFRFNDMTDYAPVDLGGEDPAFGREFGQNVWSQQEKDDWKNTYATAATNPFNNSGIKIACKRPGWEDIVVTPRFHIREVPQGQQHFVIDATKAVLTDSGGGKKLQSGGVSGAGHTELNGVSVASVLLQEQDVYDKFQDPRLHTYLHAVERSTNVEPAYLLDRKRLEEALGRLGIVDFAAGRSAINETIRNLADSLKRLEIPSTLASLHPIKIKGIYQTTDAGWATRAATLVQGLLIQQGVHNPTEIVAEAGAINGVIVESKPVDPVIKDTYVTNWSRFTAAHEFGHMIGLIDEYYGAASSETVKEMISAGWLPPDTRSDHLKLHPPKKAAEKAKQESTMKLLARAGLESPDFAMDPPGTTTPKTTSLMTGGYMVNKEHMITAWEALVTMTGTHVDEKYWKIT